MSQIIPYLNRVGAARSNKRKSFSNVSNYTLLKLFKNNQSVVDEVSVMSQIIPYLNLNLSYSRKLKEFQ